MRCLVGLLLLASASTLTAQRAQIPSADAVARDFFDALEKGRFIEAARHLDTAFFADSKRRMLETYRRPRVSNPISVDEMMKHDPELPRVVAEYYVKRSEQSSAQMEFAELEYMFADVPDTMSLKLLSARELAARWLEARDMRYTFRKLLLSNRCKSAGEVNAANVDSALKDFPVATKEVLGLVARADTAYVLYRERDSERQPNPMFEVPRVITMTRADRWRVQPTETFSMVNSVVGCG